MSHPWNKVVRLHLGAQQLRADCEQASAQAPWSTPLAPALDAVLGALQQQANLGKAPLEVTLADAHVHFDVVTGDYAAYSDAQLQAIAMGCVSELLGDAADSQVVRWQLQPDMCHLLLCAIAQPLVEAVVQAAERHQLRLASLQPAFCQHWNRHAAALPNGNGVVTVLDGGHSLVAFCVRGSIAALSYGAWTTGSEGNSSCAGASLDRHVDRLLASEGLQAQALTDFVLLPQQPLATPPSARWTVREAQEATA